MAIPAIATEYRLPLDGCRGPNQNHVPGERAHTESVNQTNKLTNKRPTARPFGSPQILGASFRGPLSLRGGRQRLDLGRWWRQRMGRSGPMRAASIETRNVSQVEIKGKQIERGLLTEARTAGGGGAQRGDAPSRIRAARPSHYLWPTAGLQWKGEKGSTDCEGGKSFGPAMGLSSGCIVGLELIEGES